MTSFPDVERFQILSLDGGGIRGVFTAAVLAAIENDYDTTVTDHFDLIAGTSTGGIVALALGLGIDPRDIVKFYFEHGRHIFSDRLGFRRLLHWGRRKYPAGRLAHALRTIVGERLLGESQSRLVIPAFNIAEGDVYVFRTPHLEKLRRDYRVPAWQVAMATAAAPTYFSTYPGISGQRLVDGGVWANNPSLVALVEAVGALEVPQDRVALLSVGTVSALRKYRKGLDEAGKVGWATRAADMILDATLIGVVNQARFLLGSERFHRVTALTHEDEVSLDRASSVSDLIAKAAHISRKELPVVAGMFLEHKAAPYQPIHSAP